VNIDFQVTEPQLTFFLRLVRLYGRIVDVPTPKRLRVEGPQLCRRLFYCFAQCGRDSSTFVCPPLPSPVSSLLTFGYCPGFVGPDRVGNQN